MCPYLTILKEKCYISAMAKFRCSAHKLACETGRYAQAYVSMDERICLYCLHLNERRVIENEYHVLCHCPRYNYIRVKFLNDLLSRLNVNNENIVITLLKTNNEKVIKQLSLFLYYMFKIRDQP